MSNYAIKSGCEYSRWTETSPWKAFYHEEGYLSGSGPSKTSQRLALWYVTLHPNWPYLALQSLTADDIQSFYQCSPEEAQMAMSYIKAFFRDVEKRFL